MSEKVVIEKDLNGGYLTSGLVNQMRGEIIVAKSEMVDIIIRNVWTMGEIPEVIVDYGGHILQTYQAALRLLLEERQGELIKEVDSLEYLGKHGAPGSIVP